jgi:hypothetical protein
MEEMEIAVEKIAVEKIAVEKIAVEKITFLLIETVGITNVDIPIHRECLEYTLFLYCIKAFFIV